MPNTDRAVVSLVLSNMGCCGVLWGVVGCCGVLWGVVRCSEVLWKLCVVSKSMHLCCDGVSIRVSIEECCGVLWSAA